MFTKLLDIFGELRVKMLEASIRRFKITKGEEKGHVSLSLSLSLISFSLSRTRSHVRTAAC